ncbi:MAG: hypothetical protein U0992_20150 [Planctomycetaceae bacterium]
MLGGISGCTNSSRLEAVAGIRQSPKSLIAILLPGGPRTWTCST